jgi:hypothetical protein
LLSSSGIVSILRVEILVVGIGKCEMSMSEVSTVKREWIVSIVRYTVKRLNRKCSLHMNTYEESRHDTTIAAVSNASLVLSGLITH